MRTGRIGSLTGSSCTNSGRFRLAARDRQSCKDPPRDTAFDSLICGVIMRPLGWIGVLLVVGGITVVAMRGIPYTKSHNEVEVGPLKVTSQERGMVPVSYTHPEPTRLGMISYAVFCLKKKKKKQL